MLFSVDVEAVARPFFNFKLPEEIAGLIFSAISASRLQQSCCVDLIHYHFCANLLLPSSGSGTER